MKEGEIKEEGDEFNSAARLTINIVLWIQRRRSQFEEDTDTIFISYF